MSLKLPAEQEIYALPMWHKICFTNDLSGQSSILQIIRQTEDHNFLLEQLDEWNFWQSENRDDEDYENFVFDAEDWNFQYNRIKRLIKLGALAKQVPENLSREDFERYIADLDQPISPADPINPDWQYASYLLLKNAETLPTAEETVNVLFQAGDQKKGYLCKLTVTLSLNGRGRIYPNPRVGTLLNYDKNFLESTENIWTSLKRKFGWCDRDNLLSEMDVAFHISCKADSRARIISDFLWGVSGESTMSAIYICLHQALMRCFNLLNDFPISNDFVISAELENLNEENKPIRLKAVAGLENKIEAAFLSNVPVIIVAAEIEDKARQILDSVREDNPLKKTVTRIESFEDIEETLDFLSRKADNVINNYVFWLSKQVEEIDLFGTNQKLSLKESFVTLKVDSSLSNSFIRKQIKSIQRKEVEQIQMRSFLKEFEANHLANQYKQKVAYDPWYETLNKNEKNKNSQITIEEISTVNKRVVILGDPGSGKTTFAKWLALKFSSLFLNPADSHFNRNNNKAEDEEINKLPIFIKISDFGQWLESDCNSETQTLSNPRGIRNMEDSDFLNFLGQHYGRSTPKYVRNNLKTGDIPQEELRLQLLKYIDQGRVVLILDGLDEVTNQSTRKKVVWEVDRFVKDYCKNSNSVIITSRVAGYQEAPLDEGYLHCKIQDLSENIAEFSQTIFKALDVKREKSFGGEHYLTQSAAFCNLIELPEHTGARALCSNPFTLTLLIKIYAENKTLPETKSELYEIALKHAYDVWEKERGLMLDFQAITLIISQFAVKMYLHPYNLLPISEAEDISIRVIQSLRGKEELSEADLNALKNFVDLLGKKSNIIVDKGADLLSFLHRTFQEYFAALWLIENEPVNKLGKNKSQISTERLKSRFYDSSWQETILLAFDYISWAKPTDFLNAFIQELIDWIEDNKNQNDILPIPIIYIAQSLPKMKSLSLNLQKIVVSKLIECYVNSHDESLKSPALQKKIELTFQDLYKASHVENMVETVFYDSLKKIKNNRQQGLAAARLIKVLNCYTPILLETLIDALPFDDDFLNYPINEAIKSLVEKENENLLKTPIKIPVKRDSLREILINDNGKLTEKIVESPDWLRLITLIYGGVGKKKHIVSEDSENKGEADNKQNEYADYGYEFSPDYIYCDSPLTPVIVHVLIQNDGNIQDLIPILEQILDRNLNNQELIIDSLLTLIIIDHNRRDELIDRLKHLDNDCLEKLTAKKNQILNVRKELVFQSISTAIKHYPKLFTNLEIEAEMSHAELEQGLMDLIDLGSTFQFTGFGGNSRKLPSLWDVITHIPQELKPQIMGKAWANMIAYQKEDPVYNIAVTLDTCGGIFNINENPEDRLKFLAESFAIANSTEILPNSRWKKERMVPEIDAQTDILAKSLEMLDSLNSDYESLVSWALKKLAPALKSRKDLMFVARLLAHRIKWENYRLDALNALGFENHLDIPIYSIKNKIGFRYLLETLKSSRRDISESRINLREIVDRVDDRAEKVEMLIELIEFNGMNKERESLLRYAKKEVLLIQKPQTKVLVTLRLISLLPFEERTELLFSSLRSIEQIEDEYLKAKILKKVRPILTTGKEFWDIWYEAVKNLTNPSLSLWVLGDRSARLLNCQRYVKNADNHLHLAWATITGSSNLQTTFESFSSTSDFFQMYENINTSAKDQVISVLCRMGASEGLPLTIGLAQAIEILIIEANFSDAVKLLRLTGEIEPGAVNIVRKWLLAPELEIRQLSALILAEYGEITLDSLNLLIPSKLEALIDGRISLLESTHDRTRFRTEMAIYQRTDKSAFGRLRTSRIDKATIEKFAELDLEYVSNMKVSTSLLWFWENLVFDEPNMLKEWVSEAASGSKNEKISIHILKRLYLMNEETWKIFIDSFRHQEITKYLLHSAEGIAKQALSPEREKELGNALTTIFLTGDSQMKIRILVVMSLFNVVNKDFVYIFESEMSDNPHPLTLFLFGKFIVNSVDIDFKKQYINKLSEYIINTDREMKMACFAGLVMHLILPISWLRSEIIRLQGMLSGQEEIDVQGTKESLRVKEIRDNDLTESIFLYFKDLTQGLSFQDFFESMLLMLSVDRFWGNNHEVTSDLLGDVVDLYIKSDSQYFETELLPFFKKQLLQARDNKENPVCRYERTALIIALEKLARRIPGLLPFKEMEKLITNDLANHSWVIRKASPIALAYTGGISLSLISKILNLISDVKQVRDKAFESVDYFRTFDDGYFEDLLEFVKDESAVRTFMYAKFLLALSKNILVGYDKRQIITEKLIEIYENCSHDEALYSVIEDQFTDVESIKYVGNLKSSIHELILQISGLQTK